MPVLWRYNNEVGDLNLQEVEESVKARTKGESITSLGPVNMAAAKTLCMPFEQDALPMVSNTLAEGTFPDWNKFLSIPILFNSSHQR